MDRANVEVAESITGSAPQPGLDTNSDSLFKLLRSPLSEGEGDNALGRDSTCQKFGCTLSDDLGLSRACRGNDLEVATPIRDRFGGIAFKDWRFGDRDFWHQ
jgi:hypothetical protein